MFASCQEHLAQLNETSSKNHFWEVSRCSVVRHEGLASFRGTGISAKSSTTKIMRVLFLLASALASSRALPIDNAFVASLNQDPVVVRVALAERNLDSLRQFFHEVSDPTHANYGNARAHCSATRAHMHCACARRHTRTTYKLGRP
jgi:hypothetical protein